MIRHTLAPHWIVAVSTLAFTVTQGVAQLPDTTAYWPTNGWRQSTPEQQGMDSDLLAQALDLVAET